MTPKVEIDRDTYESIANGKGLNFQSSTAYAGGLMLQLVCDETLESEPPLYVHVNYSKLKLADSKGIVQDIQVHPRAETNRRIKLAQATAEKVRVA